MTDNKFEDRDNNGIDDEVDEIREDLEELQEELQEKIEKLSLAERSRTIGTISGLLQENMTQIVSFGGVLYLLTRLIAISGRSAPTALSFLDAQGISKTVTGAIVQALPILLLAGAIGFTITALINVSDKPVTKNSRVWISIVAWFLVATVVPSPFSWNRAVALVAFFAAGILIIYTAISAWTNNLDDWPHPFQFLILYFALVAGTQLVADDQVWLAPERLQIISSSENLVAVQGVEKGDQASTLVGYVLDGNGDDWVSILLEEPRIVLRVKSDSILQRSVCRLPDSRREVPPLFVSIAERFEDQKQRAVEDVVPVC